jgi:thiamine biosynthesis lipoprotein
MVKYHGVDSVPQAAIDSVLEAVDVEFNLWRPESRINAINAFDRSDSLFQFVDGTGLWSSIWAQTLDLHAASQGAFDPTVQPLVELWGFGLTKRAEVTDEDVQALMPHVGLSFERIDLNEVTEAKQYRFTTVRKRDPQTRIDFNGIAQGMTVDLLAELLQSRGASDFMVEVGGEVRCGGKRSDGDPWRIAIDRPIASQDGLDQREMQAVVGISDAAICSPFNGYPVQHSLLSATVHAVNASTADALATACMVWGPEEGQRFIKAYREANPFERVEAYFISDGGAGEWETWQSAGWEDLVIR